MGTDLNTDLNADLSYDRFRPGVEALAKLDYNFDSRMYYEAEDKTGWNIDRYFAKLASESPGMPEPDGAFRRVQVAIRLYQFPDPRLIRAVFDPKAELEGRNMLLIAKFLGLTFEFGVRVSSVVDEVRRDKAGDELYVWGYAYKTLKGHFEIGEIRFEVLKNLRTGEIFFEIDAYSKPDRIPNFFIRNGFKVFGRPLQKYFAYSALRRMRKIAREPRNKTASLSQTTATDPLAPAENLRKS